MISRLIGLIAAVLVLAACSGGDSSDDSPPALRVGMDLNYPPFETKSPDGSATGVSVDLAKALGQHLGREVEIEAISFDGLIAALKTGHIDLIISSMTANEERRESIAFSDPYVRTGLAALVAKDSPVQTAADLNSSEVRIVARLGTTGEMFARAELTESELVVLDQADACVMEVVNGSADALIFDQLSIYEHHKRHPDQTRAILEPIQEEFWAIGLRLGDDVLRDQINDFLASFANTGGFDTLADTYLAEEKALLESMGLPFLFAPAGGWETK